MIMDIFLFQTIFLELFLSETGKTIRRLRKRNLIRSEMTQMPTNLYMRHEEHIKKLHWSLRLN
jgi:hypothetical protein